MSIFRPDYAQFDDWGSATPSGERTWLRSGDEGLHNSATWYNWQPYKFRIRFRLNTLAGVGGGEAGTLCHLTFPSSTSGHLPRKITLKHTDTGIELAQSGQVFGATDQVRSATYAALGMSAGEWCWLTVENGASLYWRTSADGVTWTTVQTDTAIAGSGATAATGYLYAGGNPSAGTGRAADDSYGSHAQLAHLSLWTYGVSQAWIRQFDVGTVTQSTGTWEGYRADTGIVLGGLAWFIGGVVPGTYEMPWVGSWEREWYDASNVDDRFDGFYSWRTEPVTFRSMRLDPYDWATQWDRADTNGLWAADDITDLHWTSERRPGMRVLATLHVAWGGDLPANGTGPDILIWSFWDSLVWPVIDGTVAESDEPGGSSYDPTIVRYTPPEPDVACAKVQHYCDDWELPNVTAYGALTYASNSRVEAFGTTGGISVTDVPGDNMQVRLPRAGAGSGTVWLLLTPDPTWYPDEPRLDHHAFSAGTAGGTVYFSAPPYGNFPVGSRGDVYMLTSSEVADSGWMHRRVWR